MNASKIVRHLGTTLLFAGLFLVSCQKQYTVSKSQYTQYAMDQRIGADSSVLAYYQPFKAKMQEEMTRVVGQTERALTIPSQPETLLGNFFTDALLTESQKKEPAVQLVFATKGGLRAPLPEGNVTVSHVFELMPFENEIVVLQLSGEAVQQLINFVVKGNGQPVAGLRLKIRNNAAEDITIAGQPFDINKTYTVVTYDYLADGGDEMSFLKNPISRRDLNKKVREALFDYINDFTSQGKKINTQLDGRIVKE